MSKFNYKNILITYLILLIIFDLFVAWKYYSTQVGEIQLEPEAITKSVGHAYYFQPNKKIKYPLIMKTDSNSNPYASDLQLFEDSKPLGPPHTLHQKIFDQGNGTYSFWNKNLYFSTSDNTDPRTNGRVYNAIFSYELHISVYIFNALGFFLIFWGTRKKLSNLLSWFIISAAVIYINYTIYAYTFYNLCLNPDSFTYLDFNLFRTPGYPILIKMIMSAFGDLRAMVPFQLNLLLGSFIALGYALRQFTNRFLGLIFTLLLFSMLPLLQLSYAIFTEASFAAFLCFHFASIGLYLKKRSMKYAVLSGLTLTIMILIRPAAYPLFAGVFLLLFMIPKYKKLTLLAIGSPVIIGILATSTFNLYKFGVFTNSTLGGISVLGQVLYGLKQDDGAGTIYENLIKDIVKKNEPLMVNLSDLSYPTEYWQKTITDYNTIIWINTGPIVSAYVKKHYPGLGTYEQKGRYDSINKEFIALRGLASNEQAGKYDSINKEIALIGLTSNPLFYARHVFAHYYGGLTQFFLHYGQLSRHAFVCYQSAKNQIRLTHINFYKGFFNPLDFTDEGLVKYKEQLSEETFLDKIWGIQISNLKPLSKFMVGFSLLALLSIFFRKYDPTNGFMFYVALLLHAYIGFVAVTAGIIERYVVPFTPILYLISFLVLFSLTKFFLQQPWRSKLSFFKGKD